MVLEAANNLTKPLRLPARRRGSSLMREVDVSPLANIDNAPEGTLGVLGYATFGQEIDAIVRFAKQAIALHTPTENELADGAKDNRPHVALLFRSKTQMSAYEDALEQAAASGAVNGAPQLAQKSPPLFAVP